MSSTLHFTTAHKRNVSKRLDSFVKDWATSRFSGLGLDITIVCATAPSYTTDAHAADSTKLLRDAAAAKHAKHAADCHAQQYEYATAAWSTLGGMGGEFLHKYFNPYYQEARAKAKAAGESVHAVSQERQMWCERFAAAIAVRNRRMLDRTRDANSIAAYKLRLAIPRPCARSVLLLCGSVWVCAFRIVLVCPGLCLGFCARPP